MSKEKDSEKKEETKKEETKQKAPEAETKKEETKQKAPEAEAKKEEPKKTTRPSTCSKCSKALKRKTWYYRDGKWFCCKGCFKSTKAEIAAKKAEEAKHKEEKQKEEKQKEEEAATPSQ